VFTACPQARELWKLRFCRVCRRLVPRDRNAAVNILMLGLLAALGEPRPVCFCCTRPARVHAASPAAAPSPRRHEAAPSLIALAPVALADHYA